MKFRLQSLVTYWSTQTNIPLIQLIQTENKTDLCLYHTYSKKMEWVIEDWKTDIQHSDYCSIIDMQIQREIGEKIFCFFLLNWRFLWTQLLAKRDFLMLFLVTLRCWWTNDPSRQVCVCMYVSACLFVCTIGC